MTIWFKIGIIIFIMLVTVGVYEIIRIRQLIEGFLDNFSIKYVEEEEDDK